MGKGGSGRGSGRETKSERETNKRVGMLIFSRIRKQKN